LLHDTCLLIKHPGEWITGLMRLYIDPSQ